MPEFKSRPKRTKDALRFLTGNFVEVLHKRKKIRRKWSGGFIHKPGGRANDNFRVIKIDGTTYRVR